jgi:hypothetical protein
MATLDPREGDDFDADVVMRLTRATVHLNHEQRHPSRPTTARKE